MKMLKSFNILRIISKTSFLPSLGPFDLLVIQLIIHFYDCICSDWLGGKSILLLNIFHIISVLLIILALLYLEIISQIDGRVGIIFFMSKPFSSIK
jgi:hypothetical protein